MGAFCVFGVSLAHCRERARKDVPRHDKELERDLTMEEFEARVDQRAKTIFGQAKPRQISPEFDAPQFCREWIEVARREGGASELAPSWCARRRLTSTGTSSVRRRRGSRSSSGRLSVARLRDFAVRT